MAQHPVDKLDAGRHPLLYFVDYPVWSALAVEMHDLGGLWQAVDSYSPVDI